MSDVHQVISLRKFSRVAPELSEPAAVTHDSRIIGDYYPRVATPRSAQDGSPGAGTALADADSPSVPAEVPARAGAPRLRSKTPGDVPKAGMTQVERDAVLRRVNRAGSER